MIWKKSKGIFRRSLIKSYCAEYFYTSMALSLEIGKAPFFTCQLFQPNYFPQYLMRSAFLIYESY
jgi:hypothetical protein